jgi:hypothetical protein
MFDPRIWTGITGQAVQHFCQSDLIFNLFKSTCKYESRHGHEFVTWLREPAWIRADVQAHGEEKSGGGGRWLSTAHRGVPEKGILKGIEEGIGHLESLKKFFHS